MFPQTIADAGFRLHRLLAGHINPSVRGTSNVESRCDITENLVSGTSDYNTIDVFREYLIYRENYVVFFSLQFC